MTDPLKPVLPPLQALSFLKATQGKTFEDIAWPVGAHPATVALWLAGKNSPRLFLLDAVLAGFGYTLLGVPVDRSQQDEDDVWSPSLPPLEALEFLARTRKLTNAQLGCPAGVTSHTLSLWRLRRRCPRLELIEAVLKGQGYKILAVPKESRSDG